MIQQHTELTCT